MTRTRSSNPPVQPVADPAQLGRLRRIRWGVRLTLLLGVAASVAANVLHADPNPISQGIAAWPPLALLLTVELISRVPVLRRSRAVLRILATAAISAIAAWVSYWHMVGVASRYGEQGASPYLLPFSVDGLIVVASISLVELAAHIRAIETRLTAQPTAVPNGPAPASTPAAAPAAPQPPATPTPVSVPTLPTTAPPAPAMPASAPVVAEVPTPAEVAARITPPRPASTPAAPATVPASATRATARPRASSVSAPRPARRPAPSTTDTLVTASDAAAPVSPVASPDQLARARQVAAQYRTEHGTPITAGQLAVRLRVTTEQATQLLAVLDLDVSPTNPTTPTRTVNGRPVRATR